MAANGETLAMLLGGSPYDRFLLAAAPDQNRALVAAEMVIAYVVEKHLLAESRERDAAEALDEIRAALAKARGGADDTV